jgi:two-component system chemotaxis response regulator CheY
MKILIVEDDAVSRKYMQSLLSQYGECDIVIDGLEALDSFLSALKSDKCYDFIFLDVMLPKVDGMKVLKTMRELEKQKGLMLEKRSKILLTTALSQTDFVKNAVDCDGILEKPVNAERITELLGANQNEF